MNETLTAQSSINAASGIELPVNRTTNRWTNRKPFEVTDQLGLFKRIKKWFGCRLCGHTFVPGDVARWIYCNSTPGQTTGNFFVCSTCDGTDDECRTKGKESFNQAVKLSKQWDIYGPDWMKDVR